MTMILIAFPVLGDGSSDLLYSLYCQNPLTGLDVIEAHCAIIRPVFEDVDSYRVPVPISRRRGIWICFRRCLGLER